MGDAIDRTRPPQGAAAPVAKRLLYVAYFFPPAGGAGVQRSLKFAKYLPHFGWQVHVLSVADGCYFAVDPTLLAEIPAGCALTRTYSLEVERLAVLRAARRRQSQATAQAEAAHAGRVGPVRKAAWPAAWAPGLWAWPRIAARLSRARRHLLPDPQIGWLPFALRAAHAICRSTAIDAIVTTSSPYSAHLVGLLLKWRLGLPWIADFRDAWSDDPMGMLAHHRVHAALEAQVLRHADRVVGVTDGLVDLLRQRGPRPPRHVPEYHVVANGYDADDFVPPAGAADRPEPHATFELTMTGSLYGPMTAVPLYRALARFMARVPEARGRVRLNWVGQMDRRAAHEARRAALCCGVAKSVVHVGYVSHRASIAWLLRADVLLLILYPGPQATQVMTGKVFEYLAAGRPILALAAGTAAGELIAQAQAGIVVHPHDVNAIAAALATLWRRRAEPRTPCAARDAALGRYHRRTLAGQFAGVLDAAVACGEPAWRSASSM